MKVRDWPALNLVIVIIFSTLTYWIVSQPNIPSANLYDTMEIGQKMDQQQTQRENLETPLFPADRFLSNLSCVYGSFQPETNTIPITLSFQPNTSYTQYEEAILHCNGTNIPLSFKDGSFTVTYETNIFEMQSISAITFLDHDMRQKKSFSWNINPINHAFPQFFSVTFINSSGRLLGALKYSGSVHVFVGHFPEEFSGFQEIYLIKMLDGKEESRQPIRGHFQNHFREVFYIQKKVHGKVPDGSTLELVIELVDVNGIHYRCSLLRFDSDGNGIWDPINTTRVYGKDGTFVYQIPSNYNAQ